MSRHPVGHPGPIPAVEIREVGPRDGLQSQEPVPVEVRIALVDGLAGVGLGHIEAVSFVSPRAVPQMADPDVVMAGIRRREGVVHWGLVPNRVGAERAVAADMDALTMTLSACPVYNRRNVGRDVEESLAEVEGVVEAARGRVVDVVVSCAFGSPYTGDEATGSVPGLVDDLRRRGAARVTLADTTGMATPARVERLLERTGTDVGLHLHDTRGTALVNAWHAHRLGVRRFDTALGGLGGSPFARGAGGNLATEDLVHVLEDAGITTGVDLAGLLALCGPLAEAVGHPLPGRIATHGPRWSATETARNAPNDP